MEKKLNGISLFTGYAGIDLALSEYVQPILYCEIERYAQAIILSRMDDGSLPFAPIWNDVTTLNGELFKGLVDIIYGGFPCQDISSAGKGAGLEGKRSGLFYEVIRICKEASPLFIFLENVAAIRTRGSIEVQEELASIGYDTRFGMLSAAEVGAVHERDRWFCLAIRRDAANTDSTKLWEQSGWSGWKNWQGSLLTRNNGQKRIASDADSDRSKSDISLQTGNERESLLSRRACETGTSTDSLSIGTQVQADGEFSTIELSGGESSNWKTFQRSWPTVAPVCRADDVPANRVDRIKALGNGVVPLQVKTAFEILIGMSLE